MLCKDYVVICIKGAQRLKKMALFGDLPPPGSDSNLSLFEDLPPEVSSSDKSVDPVSSRVTKRPSSAGAEEGEDRSAKKTKHRGTQITVAQRHWTYIWLTRLRCCRHASMHAC